MESIKIHNVVQRLINEFPQTFLLNNMSKHHLTPETTPINHFASISHPGNFYYVSWLVSRKLTLNAAICIGNLLAVVLVLNIVLGILCATTRLYYVGNTSNCFTPPLSSEPHYNLGPIIIFNFLIAEGGLTTQGSCDDDHGRSVGLPIIFPVHGVFHLRQTPNTRRPFGEDGVCKNCLLP